MKRAIIATAAGLWAVSVAVSLLTREPGPGVVASALLLLAFCVWLPFAAVRWASRELMPSVRWIWLAVNAAVAVFAAPVMTWTLLVFSLIVINACAWLVFVLGLQVQLWQTRRAPVNSNGTSM